jgi:hypothetical protein
MDIFFHVYLQKGYTHILLSKFKKFQASGLYGKTNKIYLTLFGDVDNNKEFLNDLKELYPKIEYAVITNKEFHSEPDTLNFMLKKAKEYTSNTPMLYVHTKGISHTNPIIKRNIDAWVRYLDLYVIKQWEDCLKALETYDTAGPFFCSGEFQHYQGNFWWANSNYIKTLPKIDFSNVKKWNRGEYWVLSNTTNPYAITDISKVDLYQTYYCNEEDFSSGW